MLFVIDTLQARDSADVAVDVTCATLGLCGRSGTEVIILGAKAVKACRYGGWLADCSCWGLWSGVKSAACQAGSRCKSRLRHRGLRLLQKQDACQTMCSIGLLWGPWRQNVTEGAGTRDTSAPCFSR